jgi:tetratricopeptide (TPR) repeat protein
MDCGRYENQKFATGEALDPQTWKPLSDHELAFLEGHFRAQPEYAASQDDLVMAGLLEGLGQNAPAAAALDSALAVCPMNAAAWDAKTAFLERTGAPPEALRAHHEAAARQFASQPDLKAEHLAALAEIARQSGDTAAAGAYDNQIITQNAGDRTDLGVQTLAKQILDLTASGQLDDAFKKYRQQVDDVGKNGGSGFFYAVVRPFVSALLAAGQQRRAKEAMDLARTALNPPAGTTLERDMDALDVQVLAATPNQGSTDFARP